MVVTESYFVLQFVLRNQFYNGVGDFSKIFNTAYEEFSAFGEVLNVYREYFFNPDTQYGKTTKLANTISDYWNYLYEIEKRYRDVSGHFNSIGFANRQFANRYCKQR